MHLLHLQHLRAHKAHVRNKSYKVLRASEMRVELEAKKQPAGRGKNRGWRAGAEGECGAPWARTRAAGRS